MIKNRNKRIKNFLMRGAVLAAGILILAAMFFPLKKNIVERRGLDGEIAELNREIADLEGKNSDLYGLIEYLNSPQYVEEQSRLNLGLKKPGEEVAIISDDAAARPLAAETGLDRNSAALKDKSNPALWLNYFFKKK